MRRTVATLLVVATALVMAVPVGASGAPLPGPAAVPGAPVLVEAPAAPAAPPVVEAPALPAPAAVHAPAAPPAVQAPAAPPGARPAVKPPRTKASARAGVTDAAYTARLQADLCVARQIFCGLDHGGRYPAS